MGRAGLGEQSFNMSGFMIELHSLDRVAWYEDKHEGKNVKTMEENLL